MGGRSSRSDKQAGFKTDRSVLRSVLIFNRSVLRSVDTTHTSAAIDSIKSKTETCESMQLLCRFPEA